MPRREASLRERQNVNRQPTILLLEDNRDDVILMLRAFKKNDITHRIQVLNDGDEGIEYMKGAGRFADRTLYPFPTVIILDLKMPRKNGLEFLEWLRANPKLRVIPTILLSASQQERDVVKAYDLGVNTYFMKPGRFEELVKLVSDMQNYWNQAIKPEPHF